MKKKRTSVTFLSHNVFNLFLVITIVIISFPYCNREKDWSATLSKISPPPLPPPLEDIPTMEGADTIWKMVDEYPLFPGGEELLVKYIARNTNYPESARINKIQGQVVVKFCITKKGKITGYEIVKSVSPDLDAEALRVVKTLQRFEPARKDGEPVTSWYYLPITFTLR